MKDDASTDRRGFFGRISALLAGVAVLPWALRRRFFGKAQKSSPKEMPSALRRPPAEVLTDDHLKRPGGWAG